MELILGRGEGEGVHPAKLIPALKFNIYWTWPTRLHTYLVPTSVADPDPGSGAFLTLGSGIGFFRIPDLRSRIPNPYF
jgi:hypothetical protein